MGKIREKTCILWRKPRSNTKLYAGGKFYASVISQVYEFLYFSNQTLSLVMSLRAAAPHMVMVDLSSPTILSM